MQQWSAGRRKIQEVDDQYRRPKHGNGSQVVRKVKRSGQTFVPAQWSQSFLEDARAMKVESQYDEMDGAAHRPVSASEVAGHLTLSGRDPFHDLSALTSLSFTKSPKSVHRKQIARFCRSCTKVQSNMHTLSWGQDDDRQEKGGCQLAIPPHVPLEFSNGKPDNQYRRKVPCYTVYHSTTSSKQLYTTACT